MCQAREGMGREVVEPSVPRALSRTDRLVSTGEPALRLAPSRGDTHTPLPRKAELLYPTPDSQPAVRSAKTI